MKPDASGQYRVVLADDHTLVRQGVRSLIDGTADMTVVAEASDGRAALDMVLSTTPDLVVLDMVMPKMTGLQVAAELRHRSCSSRLLFLSAATSERFVSEAIRLGASGYVHKSTSATDFLCSCRRALHSDGFVLPDQGCLTAEDLEHLRSRNDDLCCRDLLSPREEQVVKLIAEGFSGAEIARLLVISPKTVDRHRANALEKLRLKDRVGLTRFAIRNGLIDP